VLTIPDSDSFIGPWRLKMALGRISTFIDDHRSKSEDVLVHCNAGKTRSATAVFLYLYKKGEITSESAFKRSYPAYEPGNRYQKIVNAVLGVGGKPTRKLYRR
jgi:protein-tyrosine phosphatase